MPAAPTHANANSTMPGLANIVTRIGTGSKEISSAVVDDGGPGQFLVHFQRLLGPQIGEQNPVEVPIKPTDETPIHDLAALLPFIGALGLNPAGVAAPLAGKPTVIPETPTHLAAVAVENSLPDTPAISAAYPALQGQARGLSFNLAAQTAGAVAFNEAQIVSGSMLAIRGAPVNDLSAGHEFSAQLLTAAGVNREQAPGLGSTAPPVQQVISSLSTTTDVAATLADPVITRPIGSSGWAEEIGNHVLWLSNRSEGRAELLLTPPQMGRIEISLTVKGDQAVASFASSNPLVREALEAALPRLREVLADAGIQLGQAQVGTENARQWAWQGKHWDNSGPVRVDATHNAPSIVNLGNSSTTSDLKGGRRLVDVFA